MERIETDIRAVLFGVALLTTHPALAFYNPKMGRWTARDPIEEKGEENLYAFVLNNPGDNVDPIGLYTLGDAEDSLIKKKIPKDTRTWLGGKYSERQLFDEWLALERTRGAWWTSLPRCPGKLCIGKDGTPVNPNPSIWKDPVKGGSITERYHPGGAFEMRSVAVDGHGNQCIYDKAGNVMTGPASGGTVDWIPPGIDYLWGHGPHDVEPFELAEALKRVDDYYSVRPSW